MPRLLGGAAVPELLGALGLLGVFGANPEPEDIG